MKRAHEDTPQDSNNNQVESKEIKIDEIKKCEDTGEVIKTSENEVTSFSKESTPTKDEPQRDDIQEEVTNEKETEKVFQHPAKRQRHDEDTVEVRMLIPSNVAGGIIGKGGCKIQKLRNDYRAKVNIADCRGPERVLAISGDINTCSNIVREIMQHLDSNSDEFDMRILIHQSLAGIVIGKGGAQIKELKEEIGCRLKIFAESAPQSTDRVAQILGNETQCINALIKIHSLIKGAQPRGSIFNYDPRNFNEVYSVDYGGYGSAANNNNTNARSARGTPQNRNKAPPRRNNRPERRSRPYQNVNPWANNGFPSYGYIHPYGGAFTNNAPPPVQIQEEKSSTQVSIPNDMAGVLIGRKGERIRRIRSDSNALIQIAEPLRGDFNRIITITGTSNQIDMAKYLLQECVREHTQKSNNAKVF